MKKWPFFAIILPWMASYGSKTGFLLIFSVWVDLLKVSWKSYAWKCQNQVTSPYFDQLSERHQPLWPLSDFCNYPNNVRFWILDNLTATTKPGRFNFQLIVWNECKNAKTIVDCCIFPVWQITVVRPWSRRLEVRKLCVTPILELLFPTDFPSVNVNVTSNDLILGMIDFQYDWSLGDTWNCLPRNVSKRSYNLTLRTY